MRRLAPALRLGPALVLVVGIAVTLVVWRVLHVAEERVIHARFQAEAEERELLIQAAFQEVAHTLRALAALLEAAPNTAAGELAAFAAPFLARDGFVRCLEWRPLLEGDLPPPTLRRVSDTGGCPREHDPLSGPAQRFSFESARDTGELSLIQLADPDDGGGFTLAAVLPVFARGAPVSTRGERRASLAGYFTALLTVSQLIHTAVASLGERDLDIHLIHESAPRGRKLVFAHDGAPGGPDLALHSASHHTDGSLLRVSALTVGGRAWKLLVLPGRGYVSSASSAPSLALAAGLLISGLLFLHTGALLDRARRIAHLNRVLEREIEQRRRAERVLEEQEERLRLTLESIVDGAWDWDIAADRIAPSERWLERHGWRHGPVQRASEVCLERIHPDDRARVQAALRGHLRGESPAFECEYRFADAAGEYRWCLDRGRVVLRDERGRPLRMVGANRDITEQRRAAEERARLEQQLRNAQKLESLGLLAGGIAHDFNNLLVAILGGADLAMAELPKDSPAREELEMVQLAARCAADLTRQMLAYSGRGSVEREPVELSRLVDEMSSLLRASLPKKVELRCELAPGAGAVLGDAAQLRQVVMNLLTNASDALGEGGGVVRVRTGRLVAGSADLADSLVEHELRAGPCVFVEVADDGCGMDEETQARIFDPFFTTKFHGRGLGLAAVLGIVRAHRGAIKLRSAPGQGTTFTVILPCAATARAERAACAPAPASPGAGAVLIVDDEEPVRRVAARALKAAGFEALSAAHGREGLEALRRHGPRIVAVLLDLTMPVMDGEEMLRELRVLRPELPVVLSSGFDPHSSAASALHDPHVAFLQKPYLPAELLHKLAPLLGAPQASAGAGVSASDAPRRSSVGPAEPSVSSICLDQSV